MLSTEAAVRRYSSKWLFSKIFVMLTGKHVLESLLKRVAALNACNSKERLQHRCFPVNIAKVLLWRGIVPHDNYSGTNSKNLWEIHLNSFIFGRVVQKQPPEVLLKISQNSQENTCVRVSFLKKLRDWLWHRCVSVNFPNCYEHLFWRTSVNDCFWLPDGEPRGNCDTEIYCFLPVSFTLTSM